MLSLIILTYVLVANSSHSWNKKDNDFLKLVIKRLFTFYLKLTSWAELDLNQRKLC